MKKLVVIAVLILALTGCGDGSSPPNNPEGAVSVRGSIEHLDGRTYHCFRYAKENYGGLWCTDVTAR